jgi:hypothetical protein
MLQSQQPEMRVEKQSEMRVEKLQRSTQKYFLQQLNPEDFGVHGMEHAQFKSSPDQLEAWVACA